MKACDAFLRRLRQRGLEDVFLVPGGAIMHLVDAVVRLKDELGLRAWPFHDERVAAMAADGYARAKSKPALLLVSSGPAVLNALNGVWGSHVDSVPMIVVSGQVRWDTTAATASGLRQLGDQELQTESTVRLCVKRQLGFVDQLPPHPDVIWDLAAGGRPGPVWIDWAVNRQHREVWDGIWAMPPEGVTTGTAIPRGPDVVQALQMLTVAQRPVLIVGSGVRHHSPALRRFLDLARIPCVSSFRHDQIVHDHPCWIGRQGTLGDRAGNWAAQKADLLLVVGCRMSIRNVTYDWERFSPDSKRIMVDVDPAECRKPTFRVDLPILSDSEAFFDAAYTAVNVSWHIHYNTSDKAACRREWLEQCQRRRDAWPTTKRAVLHAICSNPWADPNKAAFATPVIPEPSHAVNMLRHEHLLVDRRHGKDGLDPYLLIHDLLKRLPEDVCVVTGNAAAYIVTHQVSDGRHLMFSNSGCASMGWGLPAAIGAAIAGKRVLCIEGDGSIMQCLPALASLAEWDGLYVNLLVLCNGGYSSIRSTHQRIFNRSPLEPAPVTPLQFERLLHVLSDGVDPDFASHEPISVVKFGAKNVYAVTCLDPSIPIEPRLEARPGPDGKIATPTLDRMQPDLEDLP